MANCSCPSDLHSLSQLCEFCRAENLQREYLRVFEEAQAVDRVAAIYGCAPETLGLVITEPEAHAIAQANALDSYQSHEDSVTSLRRSLDTHARKIAELIAANEAMREQVKTLTTAMSALVQMAIARAA